MNNKTKTSIATIGLEEAHLEILEFLISYYFKEDFILKKQPDGKENICIFHINSDNDYQTLVDYKEKNPTILFAAIITNECDDKTIECIAKPLSPRKIKDVLHNMKGKVDKKTKLDQSLKAEKKVGNKDDEKKAIVHHHAIKLADANKALNESVLAKPVPPKIITSAPQKKTNKPRVAAKKDKSKIDKTRVTAKNDETKKDKTQIDDLHKLISEMKPHFSVDTAEQEANTPNTQKIVTIKGKAENNKSKQIVIEEDHSKFVASRGDVNLDNPTIVASLVYVVDEYLQGALARLYVKAKEEGEIITLDVSYGMISYNPKNHQVLVNVGLTTLQNISSMADLKPQYLPLPQPASMIIGAKWENADTLLWKTTIWASRGRLPVGTDIDTPFILKHWPNFTRFMLTPHAMEITALWIHEPITLRKTIALLSIPQRTVFSFYSAVIALDFVVLTPENKEEQQVIPIPTKKKKRRFFSKLLHYFKPDNIEKI